MPIILNIVRFAGYSILGALGIKFFQEGANTAKWLFIGLIAYITAKFFKVI